ncbi:kinase-like domain-containing protein [Hypoxylon cercidicola]|nr:kinase-like domain-containing protein [Hypoxylon cercidicola]
MVTTNSTTQASSFVNPANFSMVKAHNLSKTNLLEIPTDKIWPTWDARFTRAPQQLPPNTYVKTPSLLAYNPATSSKLGNQLLIEADVCQILMAYPHPNIVKYLGCIVENGMIKGLCFTKLPMTLARRLRMGKPLDTDHCIKGIESGVHHLHKLGFINNDLNPSNIMMDGDNPIIIDFDSSKREGEELGWKEGTIGWAKEGIRYANRDNDFYGISQVRRFLMGMGMGRG